MTAEPLGLSVGQTLPGLLADYGIEMVFGIPGVHNVELYRGMPHAPLTHVLPRHEQGAGFMADGYARVTGKPAACFTITGPGVTNILTPLGQAYSDSIPMLVIASCLELSDQQQDRGRLHQMIDQRAAAASVTAFAAQATSSQGVLDLLARAFALFRSERPRPAYIEIPIDVLAQPATGDWRARALPHRPLVARTDLEKTAHRLARARRPFIILGGGSLDAGPQALQLAELLGAPIATTLAAKGVVPDHHPLSFGAHLAQPALADYIGKSDAVLVVGSELAETDIWREKLASLEPSALIRVDLDPNKLVDQQGTSLPLLGDAQETLTSLLADVTALSPQPRLESRDEVARLRQRLSDTQPPQRKMHEEVLQIIRQAVPDDTVIASDMTQLAYAANEALPFSQPRCWLHPAGFGTLGYALPAAIGAALAQPGKATVALAGDYGFQYSLNDLGVAAELNLPVVVLLWNNNALGEIRDDMVRKQISPNAVEQKNPDFIALAKAYGLSTFRPHSPAALALEIRAALASGGPCLIEINQSLFEQD
ncbi:5-guanidino-2-oxopentanoate decarboxylase [Rhodovibrionaceae bacterium A322]